MVFKMKIDDLLISDSVLLALALLIFCLRLQIMSRRGLHYQSRKVEILGVILQGLSTATIIAAYVLNRIQQKGSLRHRGIMFEYKGAKLPWGRLPHNMHKNVVIVFLQAPQMWFLKGAYLCTFWTFAEFMRKIQKRAIVVLSVYMALSYVALLLAQLFHCWPVSKLWEFDGTYSKCMSENVFAFMPAVVNFVMTVTTDVGLLIFALLLVRTLRAQKRVRLSAVAVLVLIATLSIIASITRFVYNFNFLQTDNAESKSYAQWHMLFWQQVEVTAAVVAYGLTIARGYIRLVAQQFRRFSSTSISVPKSMIGGGDKEDSGDDGRTWCAAPKKPTHAAPMLDGCNGGDLSPWQTREGSFEDPEKAVGIMVSTDFGVISNRSSALV